VLYTI